MTLDMKTAGISMAILSMTLVAPRMEAQAPDSLMMISVDSVETPTCEVREVPMRELDMFSLENQENILGEKGSDGIRRSKNIMDKDGHVWRTYAVDDMVVGLNVDFFRNNGRFWKVDVYVLNKSGDRRYLDFDKCSVTSPDGRARLFSDEQFFRRQRRRRFWKNFGIQSAIFTTSVVGSALLYDEPAETFGEHVFNGVAQAMLIETAFISSEVVSAWYAYDYAQVVNKNLGYLSSYAISDNEALQGIAYSRWSPSDIISINLSIDGKIYSFEWTVKGLRENSRFK